MTDLHWPLSILAKAVHHKNLSAAAQQIGLSQPQISRLIHKLESDLEVHLLDRSSRRHSTWTAKALELAEAYAGNQRRFEMELRGLVQGTSTLHVHFGTLEGLADEAMRFAKKLFDNTGIPQIELDVFDQNELEAKFLSHDLDVILTSRVPGRGKPAFHHLVGYQNLDQVEKGEHFSVVSSHELAQMGKKSRGTKHTLVSNSLSIRQRWLEENGGRGQVPSKIQSRGRSGLLEVILVGGESLDPRIWKAFF